MENLATIQRIRNIRKHPNADTLSIGQVLGWQVIFNHEKDSYKENDLVVYIAIDTILPEKPEFEFLRNKNFRIKPIRLRGTESAGICFPLSILPNYTPLPSCGVLTDDTDIIEGLDVTDLLKIVHYEKPISPELAGQAIGGLPGFLIMTDELNLRSYPDALPELFGRSYYITRKDDGSSGTYFIRKGEFGVCSRKIHLKENKTNGFWRMAYKYNIEAAIRKAFPDMDVAIQGECVGPGIQKNNLGLTELELHLFNVFDINKRLYLDYDKVVAFSNDYNIQMVSLITEGVAFGMTLEELIKLANDQKYPFGGPAEGIVLRGKESFSSQILKKQWSVKILNENYKEK